MSISKHRNIGTSVPFLYLDETLLVQIIVNGIYCKRPKKQPDLGAQAGYFRAKMACLKGIGDQTLIIDYKSASQKCAAEMTKVS